MLISFTVSKTEYIFLQKKESKRASRISLMANINGFFLTVPVNSNEAKLNIFLQNKKNWISKTYDYYKRFNSNFGKKYDDNLYIYYLGQKYTVNWYLRQSSIIINERITILSTVMNVRYNKIKIKDNSSRWGSCSSKGNLNFSLYLVAFPMDIIDYVIIHELAHLKEFNHSKKFWEIVMKMDQNYKQKICYLKKYGNFVIL